LREEVRSLSPFLFVFELCAHLVHLEGDIFVIGGEVADVCEIRKCFLPLSRLGEPSRSFFAEEHAEEEDTAGDKLKGKGNYPLRGGDRHVAVDSVRNPEAEDSADLEHDFEESDKSATDGGRRDLSYVDGNDETSTADCPATDDTSSVDCGKMSECQGLYEGANLEDCGTDHQGKSSTDFFCQGEDHECAEEATALETRDDVGRVEVCCCRGLTREAEVILESRQGNCAPNKSAVRTINC